MHAESIELQLDTAKIDDAVQALEEEQLDRYKGQSGYQGMTVLANYETGRVFALSMWDDESSMKAANEIGKSVREAMADKGGSNAEAEAEAKNEPWIVRFAHSQSEADASKADSSLEIDPDTDGSMTKSSSDEEPKAKASSDEEPKAESDSDEEPKAKASSDEAKTEPDSDASVEGSGLTSEQVDDGEDADYGGSDPDHSGSDDGASADTESAGATHETNA